jgi:hypothetical protein
MSRIKELEILIQTLYVKIYEKYYYYRDHNINSMIKSQEDINILQEQLNNYIKEYKSLK